MVLEPEEEGGFTVRVPALPEIVTFGKDEAGALAMAEDAIRLVLENTLARGEPLPNGELARIREVMVTLAGSTLPERSWSPSTAVPTSTEEHCAA